MDRFRLPFNAEENKFRTKFENLPKFFLRHMEEAGFIYHIVHEFFPETFSGEISIAPLATKLQEAYIIIFKLDIEPTKEMRNMQARRRNNKNRDIVVCENHVEFKISMRLDSGYFKKQTAEELIFTF
ncbi:MAG: hypothetical protein NTY80_01055 [candidate division SR1 bacterium]|nr:hypothetical protein [candidate division SR1 bacterium]